MTFTSSIESRVSIRDRETQARPYLKISALVALLEIHDHLST